MDPDLMPRPRNMPEGHWPDFTTYYLHYPDGLREVVRATFGVLGPDAGPVVADLVVLLQGADGADTVERGRVIVPAEPATQIVFAYWADRDAYARWLARPDVVALLRSSSVPHWRETGLIALTHNETHLSHKTRLTGLSALAGTTHEFCPMVGYWGSARDRIPAAADDPLAGAPAQGGEGDESTRVGPPNMCTIRTSQDWAGAPADHVDWYLGEVEPTLRAGVEFLNESAQEAGCMAARYVRETDLDGHDLDRTCVLAHFRSLGALEHWAQHHPTHFAIFDAGMVMVRRFGEDLGVRLFHEVSVFPAGRFDADYVDCPSGVGI